MIQKIKIIKLLPPIIILALAILLTIGSTKVRLIKNIEYKIEDYFFIIRNRIHPQGTPPGIIIVSIDEASFQELKTPWPWPRRIHAQLIDNLAEAGARIIGFDIIFADPTNPIDDGLLSESIRQAKNVILASGLEITESKLILKKQLVEPIEELKNTSLDIGLASVIQDQDGFVRRMPLQIEGENILAYQIVKRYLTKGDIRYKDLSKPFIINYLGPPGTFKTVSYYQALNYKEYLPKDIFKDKIILIGLQLEATPELTTKTLDTFPTPFFSSSSTRMHGVEIQANIINTLLNNLVIKEIDNRQFILIHLALLIISYFMIWPYKPLRALIIILFFSLIYINSSIFIFLNNRVLLPILFPILQTTIVYAGSVLYKYIIVEKISMYDPLTSLLNRRNLEIQLERQIKYAFGHRQPLSVAMADIDHFKRINDTYGHQAGDFVLKKISYLLRENIKKPSIISRYGGEEFCIIMPDINVRDAFVLLNNVREIIANTKLEKGPDHITMSFGVSPLGEEDNKETIIKKADSCLYLAKERGRNQVVMPENGSKQMT